MQIDLIRRLAVPSDSKVVLCVLDGLGGLPGPKGRTELEEARTDALDRLAERGAIGLTLPVGYAITPGSGPGHLALFGYDPLEYDIGRGVLEATGIDFPLEPNDLAARGNLCTVDAEGRITDRRAGRVATEVTAGIAERLRTIALPGVDVFVEPVREHRFVLVLRGPGLSPAITETDPQRERVPTLRCEATAPEGEASARLVNEFVARARELLADRDHANAVTLRGWATRPSLPQLPDLWKLRAAAVTVYPMYRGLARLVGMEALRGADSIEGQIAIVREHWDRFDFFFIHHKGPDAAGEDGDFVRKTRAIDEFDAALPALLDLKPNVLVVTGDHSTPATMAAHSWHPVPILMYGDHMRVDGSHHFSETECARGGLGTFPAKEVLPLAFAHAGRLAKYGA